MFPWRLFPDNRSFSGDGGLRAETFARWSVAVKVILLERLHFV